VCLLFPHLHKLAPIELGRHSGERLWGALELAPTRAIRICLWFGKRHARIRLPSHPYRISPSPTRNFHSFLFNKNCIPKTPFAPLPKFLVGRSFGHRCSQIAGRSPGYPHTTSITGSRPRADSSSRRLQAMDPESGKKGKGEFDRGSSVIVKHSFGARGKRRGAPEPPRATRIQPELIWIEPIRQVLQKPFFSHFFDWRR